MKKLILVAEDESTIRQDIVRFLELNDYKTLSAENGKAALKLAIEYVPDLIISDIMMPVFDGYDLLKELQSRSETVSIPFLFLSAKSDRSDIREGMNLGADDFITKPFDFIELLQAIESRFKKRETTEEQFQQKFEELRSNIRRSLPHEIRNPLNVILGFSELLLKNFETTKPAYAIEILSNIYSSADRLNKLFENYLMYANLEIIATNDKEIKKLFSQRTPSAKSIIRDITYSIAKEYGRVDDIAIEVEDATLVISQEYFAKIIEEIIDNCFKYSETGTKINILGKIKRDFFTLSITDHGRGMTKEQIARIGAYIQFERRIYEQQGIGLGLAIVRKIIELHNGELNIESQPNEHTTINIRLQSIDF